MRVWSTSLVGLEIRLPAGWYELASHMPWDEVRELLRLLSRGMAGVEHVVELEWRALGTVAHRVALERSVVALRVPVGAASEEVDAAKRSIGPVLVGLVQYEAPKSWADVAWQERYIKVPLLSLIKRDLRGDGHPFAKLGIGELPVDELAKLTPEPIELVAMLDEAISHRLAHAQFGVEREDWLRSVRRAAADRLALRLRKIDRGLLQRAVDSLLRANEATFSADEDGEVSDALSHVGLAWREGKDVLVSPLGRLVGEADVIGRLVERLPEEAWSEHGRAAIRAAVPRDLPTLRVNLAAPEPPYAHWPAPVPNGILERVRVEMRAAVERDAVRAALEVELETLGQRHWKPEPFATYNHYSASNVARRRAQAQITARTEVEARWLNLLGACNAAIDELADPRLLEFDFERGRIHRFDSVDEFAEGIASGPALSAFVRWAGIQGQLDQAATVEQLDVLAEAVDRGLEFTDKDPQLSAALHCLAGDLWAMRRHYRKAETSWARAVHAGLDDRARYRISLRRAVASLRVGDMDAALETWQSANKLQLESFEMGASTNLDDVLVGQMLETMLAVSLPVEAKFSGHGTLFQQHGDLHYGQWIEDALLRVCRIALAIKLENWPKASRIAHAQPSMSQGPIPVAARNRLAHAWVKACLGDVDDATATFADLIELAANRGDLLLQALAERGRALVAQRRQQSEVVVDALARAHELERQLGLPDAEH